jgi:hypothetical protein
LLIRIECNRFQKQNEVAWGQDNVLTPCIELEYNKLFESITINNINFLMNECHDVASKFIHKNPYRNNP